MGAVVLQLPDWRSECRYGIYTVRRCWACVGSGRSAYLRYAAAPGVCILCDGGGYELVLLATAEDAGGVGAAIITQGEDALAAGVEPEAYGVLDGHAGKWLAHPPWRNGR